MSIIKLPEMIAREILVDYNGYNNQILEMKSRLNKVKNFNLTRPQADYIINYQDIKPKVVRRFLEVLVSFGETIAKERSLLVDPPTKIWCEKLLCESEKAYHIYGKKLEEDTGFEMFWVPKTAIIPAEKTLDRVIDFDKYNHRPLMNHQKEGVEKLLCYDRFILADTPGTGKGLLPETNIYTPNGKTPISDINVGDQVIGSNGKECNVIGVFPQPTQDVYEITFNDGMKITTDGSHIWPVRNKHNSTNKKGKTKKELLNLTTKQMFEGGLIKIKGVGHNKNKEYTVETHYKTSWGVKWQIPIVEPITFNNNETLPMDPYLLGLGLGDGHFKHNNCYFTIHEDDYNELLGGLDLKPIKTRKNLRGGKFRLNNESIKLGLNNTVSNNKFIPEIYKFSTIENRLSLLQGLMDTDGHYNKSRKGSEGTEYTTVSKQLSDDVCELVQTLGGICRVKTKRGSYKKNGIKIDTQYVYRLNIKLPIGMNPFRLERKSKIYIEPTKYPVGRVIKNIKQLKEKKNTICISVDSKDKLFVTEHCIVTHNTTTSVVGALESGAKKVLIVCPSTLKINWKREIEHYTDKSCYIVEGKKWEDGFDFYIINYDIIKNYHKTEDKKSTKGNENYGRLVNEGFDLAIIDEAHYLSNPDASRTKLLNDVLDQIPKVWLLTGTPMTSRPINYYNLLRIVKSPLAINWQTYVRRYCNGFQFRVGNRKIWSTTGATNLDELRVATKSLVLRRRKEDVLDDLPEKTISPIYLELTSDTYNEELDEFIQISQENRDKDTLSVTLNRLMKVRQVIAMEKIPYTCELIDKCLEQGQKVVVFTNFTASLEAIHEKYKKISVVLDGRMSSPKKQHSVDRFQEDDKIKIFIGNIKAAGVGITLTAAETVINNDLSFVPADHEQADDRCFRKGQKNNVLAYYPIFENTIEMNIYNMLQTKMNNIDRVMGEGEYSENFTENIFKEIL